MAGFVAETWEDIKGNAKWDIIKWLFGGSVIATAFALVRAASLYWRMQILIFVLSVLGFAAISFYQRAQAHKRTKKALVDEEKHTAPNLVIHSAVYGTGPIDDMLVTHRLRTAVRDALVVPVDNNLVPRDPAIGKTKRLAVEYSYGNPSIQQVSRLEGERLVLPEDSEIQRLRGELEQFKRHVEAAAPQSTLTLVERTLAICKEMRAYLKEVGPEPHWDGPHGSNPDWAKWATNILTPWKTRFHAGYMLRFNDKVVRLRHELAERGLRDGDIDSVINVDVHSEGMVRQMIEALITLGAKLDD